MISLKMDVQQERQGRNIEDNESGTMKIYKKKLNILKSLVIYALYIVFVQP